MAEVRNGVKNWILKVREQKKIENNGKVKVSMNTLLTGRKHDDGTYDSGMFINVVIVRPNADGSNPDNLTKWDKPDDYTGKYISVDGNFAHSDWEKDGKKGKNFTIWASEVREYTFDDNNGGGNNSGGGKY